MPSLGGRYGQSYIWNPVALSTFEPARGIFAVEVCLNPDKRRRVDSLKGIDVDDRAQMIFDRADNKRYGATGRAHVKVSGLCAKSVFRDNGLIANRCHEFGITMRGPSSGVLGAKGTAACPDWNLGSIARPMQPVTDVSAVTPAFNLHGAWLRDDRRLTTKLNCGQTAQRVGRLPLRLARRCFN